MAYCTQSDLEARIGAQELAELTSDTPNQYVFTVSGVVVTPTAGATYTNNGLTITIVSASLVAGVGTVTAAIPVGSTTIPLSAGTLTKATGTGDATISYSALNASDPTVVAALITAASTDIDAKAGQVYSVPFDPTPVTGNCTAIPSLIFQIAVVYAIDYAYKRRGTQMVVPPGWVDEKTRADQRLDDISNELLALDGNPTVASTESNVVPPTSSPVVDFNDSNNLMSWY